MTADLTIRAATRADIDRLAAWAAAMAWETEHKRLDPDTLQRGIGAVFDNAQRGRYFIAESSIAGSRIGEHERESVGTLMLTTEWSDWRCGDWWWIQSVYVPPEHRRGGVFAALYRHVDALAREDKDVCGLRLYVEKENAVAQRTYTTLGMADAGYHMFEIALPGAAR